jgi:magnesium transporter
MAECRYFHVKAGEGLRRVGGQSEALAAVRGGGYLWVDLVDPSREELDVLALAFGIHALAVEDCMDDEQVPKIEDYPGHSFVLFNTFRYAAAKLTVEEVDFLLGRNFLVTVSGHGGSKRRDLDKVEEMAAREIANVERGPDFLLHVILDYTVDSKLATIEALEDDIEAAEEGMLDDPASFKLENLVRLRRALLSLRKSLFHEREILVKVCRKDSPFISDLAIYHFRDIYDHLTKLFEISEMNRDILTSLMEMYLSLINNRMAEVANRTNKSVRRLTLITTVFMPLTLLAGVGGMSEWSMMTGPQHWPIAYPLFLIAMLVIGGFSYHLLRLVERKDTKRRRSNRLSDG